ncbi:MAG TPA: hypothetical protein VI796_06785 [Candidatus Thermoplasmatota archaeon]|nr:hypothetical protein [Candidatus Thermoplasmatota archaeon]
MKDGPKLAKLYPDRESIPSGVCSLQLTQEQAPWIVCPHRLLDMVHAGQSGNAHQAHVLKAVIGKLGYAAGTKLGVWAEVKMQLTDAETKKDFDYSFDFAPYRAILAA